MTRLSASTSSSTSSQTTPRQDINVAFAERLASFIAGALLVRSGFKQRSTFGAAMMIVGGLLARRGLSGHCDLYATLGKNTARPQEPPAPEDYFNRGVHVEQKVSIDKPADELYRYWRKFENLPHIMRHLQSVDRIDDQRSHWVVTAPAGRVVEWDAEIINDETNKLIAWRSTTNADVHSAGSVRFIETPSSGTEVHVVLDYLPPAGQVGRWIAKLFGEEPQQQLREDLQRFKQAMEQPATTPK